MNGYWVVEVTDSLWGTYFATESWGYDEARFEEQGDAGDFAEEVLDWYESTHPNRVVHIEVAFVSDMGDKYRGQRV